MICLLGAGICVERHSADAHGIDVFLLKVIELMFAFNDLAMAVGHHLMTEFRP
jgi:hypothetical protein